LNERGIQGVRKLLYWRNMLELLYYGVRGVMKYE